MRVSSRPQARTRGPFAAILDVALVTVFAVGVSQLAITAKALRLWLPGVLIVPAVAGAYLGARAHAGRVATAAIALVVLGYALPPTFTPSEFRPNPWELEDLPILILVMLPTALITTMMAAVGWMVGRNIARRD